MCGICGILDLEGKTIDKGLINRMCSVMSYRGPDEESTYFNNNVQDPVYKIGLGHRRLSIIDLEGGCQPMSNEDGTVWIVQNGEIYNFQDLRKDLEQKGHRFKTKSDTEVIIHLYEDYGVDCVKYLRGMFAFAIWDEKKKLLLGARDRLGKKPFCYTMNNNRFLFASEIKSLIEDQSIKREVDLEALNHYLTLQYVPSPLTMFKGIKKLPPSHILILQNGKIKLEQYWQLSFANKTSLSELKIQDRILELMRECTKLRMISDVPLGALLSGGLDSSSVVSVMSELTNEPINTFTIGFENSSFDERHYAKIVADAFHTNHHELIVKPETMKILPKLIWYYNEPFGDHSIATYYVSKMAREHVKVVLCGDGGDENFAGYARYSENIMVNRIVDFYKRMPFPMKNSIEKWILKNIRHSDRSTFFRKLKWFIEASKNNEGERYFRWMSVFPEASKNELFSENVKKVINAGDTLDMFMEVYTKGDGKDVLDKILFSDTMTYLADCLMVKMDISSMANSLEVRAPLLDHKFMEFTASIPSGLKLKGQTKKYIFRKAVKKILPPEILQRKKMGFGVPFGDWFRKELNDYIREVLLSRNAGIRGYFNMDYISKLISEHSRGEVNHATRLWVLLNFELWHQIFINKTLEV